jgi:23S rRNA (uracil1939-C5)-methyltransferase
MVAMQCPDSESCGGCPLIACSPKDARTAREVRLREAFRRHLGEDAAGIPIEWIAVPHPQGYRRRIRLRVFGDARIGFFNPGKSEDCAVLTPILRQFLAEFVDTSKKFRGALADLHHVELREPDLDGIAAAYFVKHEATGPLSPVARAQLSHWLDGIHWTVADNMTDPAPAQRLALPSVWQYVPIGSFLQVNQAVNATLVKDLVASAKRRGLSSFCDLYAGSGNFTLPLLAAGLAGRSVEIDRFAIEAARRAAAAQALPSDGFEVGDAGAFSARAVASRRSYELVIVDPPRAGLRHHAASVGDIAQTNLVYCSCSPESLARDLGVLTATRFAIESVTAYDMFEHTNHLETVVWLRSRNRSPRSTPG